MKVSLGNNRIHIHLGFLTTRVKIPRAPAVAMQFDIRLIVPQVFTELHQANKMLPFV